MWVNRTQESPADGPYERIHGYKASFLSVVWNKCFFQALASNLSVSAFNTGVSDSTYAQQNNYKKQQKKNQRKICHQLLCLQTILQYDWCHCLINNYFVFATFCTFGRTVTPTTAFPYVFPYCDEVWLLFWLMWDHILLCPASVHKTSQAWTVNKCCRTLNRCLPGR